MLIMNKKYQYIQNQKIEIIKCNVKSCFDYNENYKNYCCKYEHVRNCQIYIDNLEIRRNLKEFSPIARPPQLGPSR